MENLEVTDVYQNDSIEDMSMQEISYTSGPSGEENKQQVKTSDGTKVEKAKLVRLPLARVKHIMKMDPDCKLISQDAVFLVTKATEMFLESLGKEALKYTNSSKRKTVLKRDLDTAIETIPQLCFLDGILE